MTMLFTGNELRKKDMKEFPRQRVAPMHPPAIAIEIREKKPVAEVQSFKSQSICVLSSGVLLASLRQSTFAYICCFYSVLGHDLPIS